MKLSINLPWKRQQIFVAWQRGSVSEDIALDKIKGLGRSPMSGLRRVTMEYLEGGRCLCEISVEMADDLTKIENALADSGLTIASSPDEALDAFYQANEIQDFVRASLNATSVIDLLECDPQSLAISANTPALVDAADSLCIAYQAILNTSRATAYRSIKAHLAQALEATYTALIHQIPSTRLANPAENALRGAVTRWGSILTVAAAMLEPTEEQEPLDAWRNRLAHFEREQLGR